ncbi:hypothetical protein [Actinokineospora sp. NPDC004072]
MTLVANRFAAFQADVVGALLRDLDLAGDREDLPRRLILAEARAVRAHLLSPDGMDSGPVEEFAFKWLGYARPPRAEDRQALLDAVVEVLLGEGWDSGDVRGTLRATIDRVHQGTRPIWKRQARSRTVVSYDVMVPGPIIGSRVPLISAMPPPADVEVMAFYNLHLNPGVQFLASVLLPEEMRVVLYYAANHQQIGWTEAATLLGYPAQTGESVRRKVAYRVGQYQNAQQARARRRVPSRTC